MKIVSNEVKLDYTNEVGMDGVKKYYKEREKEEFYYKKMRLFQVLCKLKKSDIRYVNSYVRAEPSEMVLPLSALYKDFRACQ